MDRPRSACHALLAAGHQSARNSLHLERSRTFRTFLTLACIASALRPAHADNLAQWKFNGGALPADDGVGSIGFFGGTATSGCNSGGGSSDSLPLGVGWPIISFAPQGREDKGRGASFSISTLGFENLARCFRPRAR